MALQGAPLLEHEEAPGPARGQGQEDRERGRVLTHRGTSVVALRLFELLPRHPVVTVASVLKPVETTKPTAGRAIEVVVDVGVLVETTGKKRDRSFVYRVYLDRLRAGTELADERRGPGASRIAGRRPWA